MKTRFAWQCRRLLAFTLIELLVVVAIIALLLAILMPGLSRARDKAKETKCAAALADFGRGFHTYAVANKDALCSGSFDPEVTNYRDGPVDKVGWVADLVNGKYSIPAEMLCPANDARVNQKLGQGPSGSFGRSYPNGDSYATWQLVDDRIKRGYNSNYTQSWYMGRTEMKRNDTSFNPRRITSTIGPLSLGRLTTAAPPSVPILGDGGIESADVYRGEIGELRELTVKSMTDGPAEPNFGPQSYSDFGPAHGYSATVNAGANGNNRDRANILFADGHVAPFIDKARDGEFRVVQDDQGQWVQQDIDARVFDGVISLGRRSDDSFTLR